MITFRLPGRASVGLPFAILVATAATLAPAAASAQRADTAGFVLNASGDWLVRNGTVRRASPGMILLASDTVSAGAGAVAGDEVVLVLTDGARVVRRCAVRDPECGRAFVLPPPERVDGWLRGVLSALASTLSHEPVRTASLVARGGRAPADAVVPLERGWIDLGAALAGASEGRYELGALTADGAPRRDARARTLSWDPSRSSTARIRGVAAGLYALRPESATASESGWVLVCGGEGCARAVAELARMRRVTDGWGDGARGEDARMLTRALLVELRSRIPQ